MDYIQEVNAMIGKYDDLMRSARLQRDWAEIQSRADERRGHQSELWVDFQGRAERLEEAALDALEAAGDFICKVEGITHG